MAFNFGSNTGFPNTSTAQTGFGLGAGATATANKPTFGNSSFSFGAGATTSTASGFGFGGLQSAAPATGFGGLQSSAPGTGFGGLQSSAPGTGFGGLQSSAPGTGFGGLQSSAPGTGFGGLQSSAPGTGFGGLQSSAPGTFGGLQSSAPGTGFGGLQSQPTATGFSGFGSGFGSGATATTTTLTTGSTFGSGTGFTGFGTAPTTSTPSTGFGFGSTFGQAAAAAPGGSLFSGFNQPPANTGFGGLGSTFGAKPAQTVTTGGFSGFGSNLGGSMFGGPSQQQQQQQQVPQNPNEAIYNSIFSCTVYGDERDTTLSRWNLLQALWGAGKAYYSSTAPPVEITQQNPFCRFKAIGYSRMPGVDNKEGLIAIVFNKSEIDVKNQQTQLVASLNQVLGNKPSLQLTVDSIKPLSDTKCQVVLCVQEKGVTGVRKIPATELSAYMMQPMQKQQLTSMGAENVIPQVLPDKEMLKAYMDSPPAGIDARLWKQAQLDNPDESRYIPVPMVGFGEVRWRIKCQDQETKLHQAFLDRLAEDISQLKIQQARTTAKATEYKRKFIELEHRILKVLVRQEVSRKMGMALQPEEEVLRSQLETLEAQLNAPTQFKGRLSEMLSQMRMQRQQVSQRDVEHYTMDPGAQNEIKQFLLSEQNGMSHLVDVIQSDLASLSIVKDGMSKLLHGL